MRMEAAIPIPGRTFLDTCVVNFILDYGEQIYDGVPSSGALNPRVIADIESLRNIFLVAQRAMFQLAVSPTTYTEVVNTTDPTRRRNLALWFNEIWLYWSEIMRNEFDPSNTDAGKSLRRQLLAEGILGCLEDRQDQSLLCEAMSLNCDVFCTRDWRTVIQHRDRLKSLPIRILTPTEWWSLIEPYAALL